MVAWPNTITCRLAQPDEGWLVKRLVEQGGGPHWNWVDWTDIYPYWFIGEVNRMPEACILSVPGKPFGRIELLCINTKVRKRHRAMLAKQLIYSAIAACRQFGSQAVFTTITETNQPWLAIIQKRGGIVFDSGHLIVKRITHGTR